MPLTPGAKLGQYEVVEAIGAGGMGEVYRARDTKLGRDVAVKVLPEEFSRDKERLERFQREAVSSPKSITRTSPRSMGSRSTTGRRSSSWSWLRVRALPASHDLDNNRALPTDKFNIVPRVWRFYL